MSSWADQSEDSAADLVQAPAEYTGSHRERPRLKLKPRSVTAGQPTPSSSGGSSKSNPFGAAKPREEVLASKGIDASLVDKRVERKANVPRLTAEQDRQVENLRKELTEIEEKHREANEMELPEEEFRVAAEAKRKELNRIVKDFHELNLKERDTAKERGSGRSGSSGKGDRGDASLSSASAGRKFERPSERRRRLEQQMNDSEGNVDDNYSSFGGNRGGRKGGSSHSDYQGSHNYNHNDDYNDGKYRGSRRGASDHNSNEGYAGDRYNY